jgi:protein SCO1
VAASVTRLLAALLAALLLTACGSSEPEGPAATGITTSDDDGYNGVLLERQYDVPSIPLTDTEGRRFDLAHQPKRTLVFFGYTNCPDICQVVMSTIASALPRLSDEQREDVQVAFVTTDPARDDAKALRTYLDRFDPSFVGLTGSLDDIVALGKPMDVLIREGRKLPSGGYEVDHSTVVVSVQGGRGDLVWTGATSPAEMAEDLDKLLGDA